MERRAIVIRGIVQGVGFRPFVYSLASRLHLHGYVKNQTGSVLIEVEGESKALDHFFANLTATPPPLAQINHVAWEPRHVLGDSVFRIEPSDADSSDPIYISPDVATCEDCLIEIANPADRRYRYAFTNCTNCGPRLSIITGAPYDRAQTTMAPFVMCGMCQAEYDDPASRRFHAQPVACPECGPQVALKNSAGQVIETDEPIAFFARALRKGAIGTLKGLGGYHLVCDATLSATVASLRQRKHRDEKPFAVMVPNLAASETLCEIDAAERELLVSARAPIVLLRKRRTCLVAGEVAPGNPWLGVMLPYTPLHHLLMRAVEGTPLVMTSGNRSDEPIAYQDDEALERLPDIAELFLVHNRPIHVRCEDSVTRIALGREVPIRRSRGYAPRPIEMPIRCPIPILAVGGQLKATFALGRDSQAILSHHLGDLDYYDAYRAFIRDVELYESLFGIKPLALVRDLHPDYAATRYAEERAASESIPVLKIQHHHAHLAGCMAENGLIGPTIGVTFDGTGFGTDEAVWGGEFLIGDYRQFQRAAHFRYVGMPGGDQAIREPWRMAIAHLGDAKVSNEGLKARLLRTPLQAVERMLESGLFTPLTSSAGRLFDAVASIAGVRDVVSYEGQAAIELESLASQVSSSETYPFGLDGESPMVIDTRPLIASVADDTKEKVNPAVISRRFHSTLVEIIACVCNKLRETTRIEAVALSGGVFQSTLLTCEATQRLQEDGFGVYRHHLVPPNDGGLSLGQAAIGAALMG
jgi:hydrogenase maturation protein HypF